MLVNWFEDAVVVLVKAVDRWWRTCKPDASPIRTSILKMYQ